VGTASEIQARQEESAKVLEKVGKHFAATTCDGVLHLLAGREVSAKRARVIRKRGDHVRYSGRTSTGKARYTWLPALHIAWS
jgi:hypothetical protein